APAEGEFQVVRLALAAARRQAAQIGPKVAQVLVVDARERGIRKRRKVMRPVGPAAFAQRANEILLGPAPDSRLRMGRDVGPVEGAEGRLERPASGEGLGVVALLGMAPDAARRLRKVLPALGVALLRERSPSGAKKQKPRRSGAQDAQQTLLFFAEVVVAVRAGLADRADLRLDGTLVAALRDLLQLADLRFEPLDCLLHLAWLLPDGRQGARLHVLDPLGARVEAIPRHLRQGVQVVGIALDDLGVERDLALRHAAERAKVLSNQGHGRLALFHQDLRLDLRESRASDGAQRHDYCYCNQPFLHGVLLRGFPGGPIG